MYLFTRSTRIRPGHMRDGMEWAVHITEKVNKITSLDVGLWTTMFSPGVGTLSWGAMVETLTDLENANAKLAVDDMFQEQVNYGASLLTEGGVNDEVAQQIYGTPDPNRRPRCCAVVRSVLANGHFQSGIECGIEIAQRASELGGIPTSFFLATTGTYAGVGWITGAETLKELEESEQAVNSNPDFMKLLDEKAAACYLPGATTQAIWQLVT